MTFWLVAGGLALAVTALFALAFVRGRDTGVPAAAYDLQVYREQLRDIDRDVARGVLDKADADRVRTEVSRRILSADAALQNEKGFGTGRPVAAIAVAGAVGVLLLAGSFWLYLTLGAPGYGDFGLEQRIEQAETIRRNRPGQAAAEAAAAAQPRPENGAGAEYTALVEQLRETVKERPDDLEGVTLLARAEARLGNFDAAHRAQARVVALKGDKATAPDLADWADMMIYAAGGYVSPEAEQVLERLLSMDPESGPGRYYYGLMLVQTGRPDLGFRLWDRLLREGPEEAPWIAPIRDQIEDLAELAGAPNYQLPQIGGTAPRGPSQADIEAAGQMSAEDRMAMIEGMVAGLSERLAAEGGPPEDWAQLINALGVLSRYDEAKAIYDEALVVFASDPQALDMVRRAAERAGLE